MPSYYYLSPDAKCRENNKFPTDEEAITLAIEAATKQNMPIKVIFRHNGASSVHVICLPSGQVKQPETEEEKALVGASTKEITLDLIEATLLDAANELEEKGEIYLAAECDSLVQSVRAIDDVIQDDTATIWKNFNGVCIKKHGNLLLGINKGVYWEILKPIEISPTEYELLKKIVYVDQIWNEGDILMGMTGDAQLASNFADWEQTKNPLSQLLVGWLDYFEADSKQLYSKEEIEELFKTKE